MGGQAGSHLHDQRLVELLEEVQKGYHAGANPPVNGRGDQSVTLTGTLAACWARAGDATDPGQAAGWLLIWQAEQAQAGAGMLRSWQRGPAASRPAAQAQHRS